MSDIVTSLASTGLAARCAQWLFTRLATYFGVAVLSGGLFFAGATIYSLVAGGAPPLPEPTKISKPSSAPEPVPIRSPSPAVKSEPTPVPMVSLPPTPPEHGLKYWIPDARVTLVGAEKDLPAGDLYERTVFTQDTSKLGTVVGFVVTRDGKVISMILSLGGFLGAGEKNIAVPVGKMTSRRISQWGLVANVDKRSLKALPEFKFDGVTGWEQIDRKTAPSK